MKKKNDFKRKNTPPERDDHEEKRAAIPPAGDIQQEIREIRQAMLNAGACLCLSKAGSPEELVKNMRLAHPMPT